MITDHNNHDHLRSFFKVGDSRREGVFAQNIGNFCKKKPKSLIFATLHLREIGSVVQLVISPEARCPVTAEVVGWKESSLYKIMDR